MASKRTSNKLPLNLPQLQNCIKRDPSSYYEEFAIQFRHYDSILQILRYNPTHVDKDFESLIMFLAHVSSCYPKQMSSFPKQIMELLRNYSTGLNRDTRMACCRALILMRSKSLLQAIDLLPLFFDLAKCQDKAMRSYIKQTTITDIKNMNAHRRDEKTNKALQRFMFNQLENDNQDKSAKLALDIMKELYRKNIWNEKDTVNQIAQACLSRSTKIMVTALKFFLGHDEENGDDDQNDDSSDDDENAGTLEHVKDTVMANKFNKKSRKRKKMLTKVKQTFKKVQNKEKVESFNFSAIHLIHDPQGLAEKLLKCLEDTSERFEVKLMIMNFISRLIGIHELILLNYYPLIQRYLQPHQMEVTKILMYAAQSAHKDVPPEELEPVLKTIAYNFVTERNSTEVMTVGLNAIREFCARAPLVMNEDLLQDLVQYQKYKNKNVSVAAKSLVYLFRVKNPDLLRKKDRGKPTIESSEFKTKKYGETEAVTFVPGTEALNNSASSTGSLKRSRSMAGLDEDEDMEDFDDDDYEDMDISDDDAQIDDSDMDEQGSSEEDFSEYSEEEDYDLDDDSDDEEVDEDNLAAVLVKLGPEAARKKAEQISTERILTSREIRRIQAAQVSKKMMAARPRRMTKKEETSNEVIEGTLAGNEKVRLGDIERLYKKSKHDKESRLATVRDGREGREKFGKKKSKMNPKSSTTNIDKKRSKSFNMIKHKIKRKKKKKTFQEKQRDLKQQLINRAKNSK